MAQKLNLIPIEEDELPKKKLDLTPVDDTIDSILTEAKKSLTTEPIKRNPNIKPVVIRSDDPNEEVEPTTFMGGFLKSIKKDILGATVGNPMLQVAAKPESLGDFGNLLLPSGIPQISKFLPRSKGKLDNIASSVIKSTDDIKPPVDTNPIQFNRKGKTGETGNIQSSINQPKVTESTKPAKITIKKPTPDMVKKANEAGYEFSHMTDEGGYVMVPSNKPPVKQPILETEVGNTRPNKLGPVIDDKQASTIAEVLNFPRAVLASNDFSAPLRQGLGLIHKKQFWTSLDDMFKAWGSEEAFNAVQKSISDKPLFKKRVGPGDKVLPSFAEDAGLKLTDLNSLSSREEMLMSTWAEKVPGVRRSNRAYTAFINKLRSDTFEALVSDAKVLIDPDKNASLAKELANFVNVATGRGSLGKLEKSATALNSTFFAPRLIASRLTMLNPHYYITANPIVRKEALKSLLAITAFGNTVTQLGRMAGGTVESDPASADFGKLKIGESRLDPYGGFQQYIVAAQRLMPHIESLNIGGRMKSTTTNREYDLGNPKFGESSRMDVMERFGRGKLNPVLGFAWSLLDKQKELSGKKMDLTTMNPFENAVAQRFIPILIQDLYEVMTNEPRNAWMLGPAAFGMGHQQYEVRK